VYRDPRPLVVQSNGQDFATLLVGLPVLGPLTLLETTVVGLAAWSLALAAGALLSITAFAAADGQPLDVVQIAILVAETAVGAALSFTALVPPARAAVSPNRPSGAMQGNQKGQS
jgi:hypothetical protein